METLQQLKFYNRFREAVKKRTIKGMVVPVSGGLDSTLIVKALYDNGDIDKASYLTVYDSSMENDWVDMVMNMYEIPCSFGFMPLPTTDDKVKSLLVLEEPFYSNSINWHLYKEINSMGSRVSMSGLGADELFGGYDYYNTERYPRGLFKEIEAKTNEEKKKHDIHFLIHHHLRENEKIGLYWEVEGRYPFLDKEVSKFQDVGKSLIKAALLQDFPESFVNRKKEGFRIDNNTNREHQKEEYLKQLDLWIDIFTK